MVEADLSEGFAPNECEETVLLSEVVGVGQVFPSMNLSVGDVVGVAMWWKSFCETRTSVCVSMVGVKERQWAVNKRLDVCLLGMVEAQGAPRYPPRGWSMADSAARMPIPRVRAVMAMLPSYE